MHIAFCVFLLLPRLLCAQEDEYPIVSTVQGQLRGSVILSLEDKDIYSFRGVRYARPPVGELRFKPPEDLEPWNGIYNATNDGAACPQAGYLGPKSEDCLFLNVYSTQLPTNDTNPKRPVIVFFHPGGFYSVAGISTIYGPQYLLDEPVILVTANYRLGALGFLSTGDAVLPGNYGFKDQVQVLRWVQQNIAAFGGDSGSVTIAGNSAGSISGYLHMVSPMSKGLFHKLIAMSGPFERIVIEEPLEQAKKQARLMDCPDDNSDAIVNCLKTKNPQMIAESIQGFIEWGYDPILIFSAVIEPDLGNVTEQFLTRDPLALFLEKQFTPIPIIIGTTRDEFAFKAESIMKNSSWVDDLNKNFDSIAPILFLYDRNTKESKEISKAIRAFYLNNEEISIKTEKALGQMFADSIEIYRQDRAAKILSTLSTQPIFYYQFTYMGRYSTIYKAGKGVPYGVSHHDDLTYLFYNSFLFPFFNKNDPEYQTVKHITYIWSSFAATGNPTPEGSKVGVTWERLDIKNPKYLEIGANLVIHDGLYFQNRTTLWEKLMPLPTTNEIINGGPLVELPCKNK